MTHTEKDPSEMSNEELLEAVAGLDEEQYPIATHARRALGREVN